MAKLLICDDSLFTRNRLKKAVTDMGLEIFEASNGEEALERIKELNPDLMLLDLLMPGLTGTEVLAKLQDFEKRPKVIVVTADIQDTTVKECMTLGAFAFVNKPPEPGKLRSEIERALV